MINNFKDKETEKIWKQTYSKKIPASIQKVALRKLFMINRAIDINDLKIPPANNLEKLKGDRIGQFSIRINDQWRICFNWHDHNAFDVEILDYH